jgi:hypothetical protein
VPEYVRVCPVCETENPPERTRCACGASLAGVDFSLKRSAPAVTAEAVVDEPASADGVVCPHADCGQRNPPGAERCVYCNRSLREEDAPPVDARPLPAALRERFRVVEAFPATGSEADILLVVDKRTGDKAVVKLYRKGIKPDFRLLTILSQSVGPTVVRVLDHGVSDGAAYEILEYVPGGTLEALMASGPLPKDDIIAIVREIADALAGIHAHRILHRDLKPENVLVRTSRPLHLALTDFGIASMTEATQHFTSVARTTKYAAPEVLTGVLDSKSDWWSLGMIVLEAASGRHPFDGLSEQVMNHQLATRPIDVRGVYDDALRVLCRGLLLRDPARRFGAAEVARWLAGDATLVAPDEREVSNVRPYRFGTTEVTTAPELALALAKHWSEAKRDLARGHIARWLENELHDYNLLRTLQDIQDTRGIGEDGKLLRFLLAATPDIPPVWKGKPLTQGSVLATARDATKGDIDAVEWLHSLVRDDVLASYAGAGHEALGTLARRWHEGWEAFAGLWQDAQRAEETWRREPRGDGAGRVVDVDDLVYGSQHRVALPEQGIVNGALLVALHDDAYVEALRGQVAAALAKVTGYCRWFDTVWRKASADPIGVLVCHAMLPLAQEDAAREARRQAASEQARAGMRDEARAELAGIAQGILDLSPAGNEDLSAGQVSELLELFTALDGACVRVARLNLADAEYTELRKHAEKLASFGASAQRALARTEEVRGITAIFVTPQRLAFAGVALLIALMFRNPVAIGVVFAAVALFVGYRWLRGFNATEDALKRLRVFGLHARNFLRSGEKATAA